MNTPQEMPAFFLSHGGGPWPWLMESMPGVFDELNHFLTSLPAQLPHKPKAILVISGHWEEPDIAIMASPKPPMEYDFFGFPAFTYRIQYPAPGDPALAERVRQLLGLAGIPANLDGKRGFDHGAYSTVYPMYPAADVPVLQMSLKQGYAPDIHLRAGHALAPLRREGVLILGSGSSYHDLRMPPGAQEQSMLFDNWLRQTLTESTGTEREEKLMGWERAPAARSAHPREDHLIPLMVAAGAAQNDPGSLVYHELFAGRFAISSFRFG